MEIWLNVLTIDIGSKIGTIDPTLVNNIWFFSPFGEVKKEDITLWRKGFGEDFPKNMEMRKMSLKLIFSYQYIMNHKRTMQIHLAHIEWICCIQECFLRGSISHYKWINFLFNFLPSLMNFISTSLPLTNKLVLS